MTRTFLSALITALLAVTLFAEDPKELVDARTKYDQSAPHPDEAARSAYLTRLVKMREKFADAKKTAAWQAVDAEIRRHPLPKDADSKTLGKLLAGKWRSPRHDYLYKKDGRWTMLPVDPDVTNGKWRIEGNQMFNWATGLPDKAGPYTLILLDEKNLVYADKEYVFYETRLGK